MYIKKFSNTFSVKINKFIGFVFFNSAVKKGSAVMKNVENSWADKELLDGCYSWKIFRTNAVV